ncbi:hypothetical protein F7725_013526, partial [Dissostichus mawsoni]
MAKLQLKAKEKQRQSLTEETQKPPKERTQKDVKKKRKADKDSSQEPEHNKKRKSEAAAVIVSETDNHNEPVEEEKKKQTSANEKRKKKKKKDQSGISVKSLPDTPVTGTAGLEETGGGEEKTETENIAPEQTAEKTPAPTGFMVLGGFDNKPVHRVLPQWLAQPDVIHRDIKGHLVNISEIHGLSALLVKKLQNNGIKNFFPGASDWTRGLQAQRHLCVCSYRQRKTLAFVIPVIHVCKVFASYAEGTSLKVVMLAGQKSFAAEQSCLSELRGGMRRSLADIVVATPGRLIIDEADRMIDSMHQSWLSQVVKAVYRPGSGQEAMSIFRRAEPAHVTAASLSPPQMPLQKLLFSATLTQNPEKLQQLGLHQPRLFSSIHSHKKPLLILHFILRMKLSPILCFTNSREAAHRLFLLVQLFGGVQAAEFSSRLSPAERKKTLKEFEQGKIQLMISTDAAARGIDINGVKCVVNYDAPQYIRTYIHRIGRTARAGKTGLAFTFLLGVQMVVEAGTPGIQKQIVKPESLKGMEARYEQTLQELANVIK